MRTVRDELVSICLRTHPHGASDTHRRMYAWIDLLVDITEWCHEGHSPAFLRGATRPQRQIPIAQFNRPLNDLQQRLEACRTECRT